MDNTTLVLLGTALLGLSAGCLSSFVVLTRRSLAGDAVAHAALPGMCAAFLIVGERSFGPLFFGALISGVLCLLLISMLRSLTVLKEDAVIAVTLSSAFGLGIVLSRIAQNLPSGNRAGLDEFIFGKAASMVRQDLIGISCVAAVILIFLVLGFERFKLWAFDRNYARAMSAGGSMIEIAFIILLCACTVIGLPAVGAVLMSALLIMPGAAARFWTDKLWIMVAIATVFGSAGCVLGVILSSSALPFLPYSLPTGPMIVLSLFTIFSFSLVAGTRRGLLVRRRRQ